MSVPDDTLPRPALRHRLEVAGIFARVLFELLLAPLHLIAFTLRRRRHREAFGKALSESRE